MNNMTNNDRVLEVLASVDVPMDTAGLHDRLPDMSKASIGASCRSLFAKGVLIRPDKGFYSLASKPEPKQPEPKQPEPKQPEPKAVPVVHQSATTPQGFWIVVDMNSLNKRAGRILDSQAIADWVLSFAQLCLGVDTDIIVYAEYENFKLRLGEAPHDWKAIGAFDSGLDTSAFDGLFDTKIRIRHIDGSASAIGFDRNFLKQFLI